MSVRKLLLAAGLFAAMLLTILPESILAQSVVSGDVTGTITDPSGAVVPNATVTITNPLTKETKTTTTNGAGVYRLALIKPGNYTLSVTSGGFQTTTRNILVTVGQVTRADAALTVGAATQTVEVTADVPVIQTDNGNITTSYSASQIAALPTPGGDITYVAETAPGIAVNATPGGFGNFTAFGLPATSNLFTMNGNDEMDPYLNLNNSGASNLTLGANELAGTTVVENGYTGQYGRNAGAQVDYVTKSGTDKFHGNASYWYNGGFLNANEWFANNGGTPLPNLLDHQWAGSLGGPVWTGHTHFFIDTEGLRVKIPTSSNVLLPSPQFQAFTLANLAASAPAEIPFYQQMFNLYNSAPGASRATPSTARNLGCGNFTGLGAGVPCSTTFRSNAPNSAKEWMFTARVDHTIGANDTLFARFRTDHGVQPTFTDPISPLFNATSTQPQYEGQLNETHIFGANLTNQIILSGLYYSAIFALQNQAAAQAAFPTTLVSSSFTALGGESFNFPQGRNVSQYQIVDDVSWQRGNHNLKFGANFRRNNVSDFIFGVLTSGEAVLSGSSALRRVLHRQR